MDKLEAIDKEIKEIEQKIKKLETEKNHLTKKGTVIRRANVKKAVKIVNDDKEIGMIALWEDGKTTICISDKEGLKGGCYTAVDGGEKLFYIAQAWAAGLSEKIKIKPISMELPTEEAKLAEKLKKK
ncbi:MAG TPA: hypothetical protein ENG41_01400 [Methanomicrobia archaeon]|nr:hypothetical protein [Methanomicrobia archaeon]